LALQPGVAGAVTLLAMLPAVGLYDQLGAATDEVRPIRSDRRLAPELPTIEPLRPQYLP
jgi:hypothetical protein